MYVFHVEYINKINKNINNKNISHNEKLFIMNKS